VNPHAASGGTDSSATPWQPLGECFDKAPFCSSGESAANRLRNTLAVSKSSGYARKNTWLGKKRNQVNSRICDRGVTLIRRSQAERAEIVTAGHHPFTQIHISVLMIVVFRGESRLSLDAQAGTRKALALQIGSGPPMTLRQSQKS
jgi:hypothetical protein